MINPWLLIPALIAAPFLVFGVRELRAWLGRRRRKAAARVRYFEAKAEAKAWRNEWKP